VPPHHELAPELVILNGKVVTVDKKDSVAEAIAVKNGYIIKVGSKPSPQAIQRKSI